MIKGHGHIMCKGVAAYAERMHSPQQQQETISSAECSLLILTDTPRKALSFSVFALFSPRVPGLGCLIAYRHHPRIHQVTVHCVFPECLNKLNFPHTHGPHAPYTRIWAIYGTKRDRHVKLMQLRLINRALTSLPCTPCRYGVCI